MGHGGTTHTRSVPTLPDTKEIQRPSPLGALTTAPLPTASVGGAAVAPTNAARPGPQARREEACAAGPSRTPCNRAPSPGTAALAAVAAARGCRAANRGGHPALPVRANSPLPARVATHLPFWAQAAPRRAAASLTRRTRAPQFCGRMWALEGGAGGGGGVDAEMGGGFSLMEEDLEVSSVRSDGATSCQTRPTSNSVLHFSSAAPNGKLARGGRQPAVLHRQRIGWD